LNNKINKLKNESGNEVYLHHQKRLLKKRLLGNNIINKTGFVPQNTVKIGYLKLVT